MIEKGDNNYLVLNGITEKNNLIDQKFINFVFNELFYVLFFFQIDTICLERLMQQIDIKILGLFTINFNSLCIFVGHVVALTIILIQAEYFNLYGNPNEE